MSIPLGAGDRLSPTDSIDQIDDRTLQMIDSGMEAAEAGDVSGPVDMEEDFPGFLTHEEE